MPTAKKPTTRKKAAPKKAATKKAPAKKAPAKKTAPKKTAPAPAPAPVVKPKRRRVELLTNACAYSMEFVGDTEFEAAMAVINSTPSSSSGGRTPAAKKWITCQGKAYDFSLVHSCKVTEV